MDSIPVFQEVFDSKEHNGNCSQLKNDTNIWCLFLNPMMTLVAHQMCAQERNFIFHPSILFYYLFQSVKMKGAEVSFAINATATTITSRHMFTDHLLDSWTFKLSYSIVLSIIFILSVTGGFFVAFVIKTHNLMRKKIWFYLFVLALSDATTSLLTIPFIIGTLTLPRLGGGSKWPTALKIAFKHAKMEKLKNENSKKRPPQAPTPHQYPGIYRIYEYGLHKASGV